MRKIGDLVITLENEKGEDIEIRTKKIDKARKNLGHWKEPEEIKEPKQFPVSEKKLQQKHQMKYSQQELLKQKQQCYIKECFDQR